jgi:hypothetical protein
LHACWQHFPGAGVEHARGPRPCSLTTPSEGVRVPALLSCSPRLCWTGVARPRPKAKLITPVQSKEKIMCTCGLSSRPVPCKAGWLAGRQALLRAMLRESLCLRILSVFTDWPTYCLCTARNQFLSVRSMQRGIPASQSGGQSTGTAAGRDRAKCINHARLR